jgi:hypothetical protein
MYGAYVEEILEVPFQDLKGTDAVLRSHLSKIGMKAMESPDPGSGSSERGANMSQKIEVGTRTPAQSK